MWSGNETVDNPAVAVCGTIQPGTLKKRLTEAHFDTGFASRLLLCQPPHKQRRWTDADVTRETSDRYERLIARLCELPPDTVVKLTPDAEKRWEAFFNRMNEEAETMPGGPARAVAMKAIGYGARLALVLHLASAGEPGSEPMGTDALERGIQLARWFRDETLRVYEKNGFAEKALPPDVRFLRKLPDTFKTKEAEALAEKQGIPRRTMFEWFQDLQDAGHLQKVKRGLYRNALSLALRTNRTKVHKEDVRSVSNVKKGATSAKCNGQNDSNDAATQNNGHSSENTLKGVQDGPPFTEGDRVHHKVDGRSLTVTDDRGTVCIVEDDGGDKMSVATADLEPITDTEEVPF